MAFITDGGGNVISFAEYTDVVQKDQRIFESNNLKIPEESGFVSVQDYVENMLQKSTDRILLKMKTSAWWATYNNYTGNTFEFNNLPSVNPNRIDPGNTLGRQQQFTDMTVYYCIKEYIAPLFAEFGNEESPEVAKITYYDAKFNDIFTELLSVADFYDADGDGVVEADEKLTTFVRTRRSRSKNTIVVVR
jgi:hypothetical protein